VGDIAPREKNEEEGVLGGFDIGENLYRNLELHFNYQCNILKK